MPYTNNPANSLTDQIRLNVGDIWPDMEMLSDEEYEYFLQLCENNVNRATMYAARSILFKIARMVRERTGDIEVYGGDWFTNYMKALELILKDPNISISLAVPYAGGISVSDMEANRCNPDNFKVGVGVYKIARRNCMLSELGSCDGLYF